MKNRFLDTKFLVSNVVAAVSLILFMYFPHQGAVQALLLGFVALFVLPMLYVKWVLHENINTCGCQFAKRFWDGVLWTVIGVVFLMFVSIALLRYSNLLETVKLPIGVESSFPLFLIYIGIVGFYIALYQFFFQGFFFFLWERVIGGWAIVLQSAIFLLFVMAVSASAGTIAETSLVILLSLLSGLIVLRTRSIVASFIFSYLSVILLVVLVIVLQK